METPLLKSLIGWFYLRGSPSFRKYQFPPKPEAKAALDRSTGYFVEP